MSRRNTIKTMMNKLHDCNNELEVNQRRNTFETKRTYSSWTGLVSEMSKQMACFSVGRRIFATRSLIFSGVLPLFLTLYTCLHNVRHASHASPATLQRSRCGTSSNIEYFSPSVNNTILNWLWAGKPDGASDRSGKSAALCCASESTHGDIDLDRAG